jgi:hypothetical protein
MVLITDGIQWDGLSLGVLGYFFCVSKIFNTFGTHVRHKDRVLRVQEDCSICL